MSSRAKPRSRKSLGGFFLLAHQRAHLKNGNQRQETNKQEKQSQEKPNRANKSRNVPPRWVIHSPGRGQKIAMQAGDHNHEPLEPSRTVRPLWNAPCATTGTAA